VNEQADDDLVRRVIVSGRPVLSGDHQADQAGQVLSTLAVPLSYRARTIGALCAYGKQNAGAFTDNDTHLLAALADHAAIAIENAHLYEAAQTELKQRREAEELITQLAYHDSLTGLPNRMLFSDRFKVALAQCRRHQDRLAVMMLDLDHFKSVNDTLGHAIGDRLLQAVGERLLQALRESDTVCRLGGDEFLLLLGEMSEPECAEKVADRIMQAIRQPFLLEEHLLCITTSIGIAIYPDDGQDEDALVRRADLAMYGAKERGRDNYQRYRSEVDRTQASHSLLMRNTHPGGPDQ